jgi:hypothetical protein
MPATALLTTVFLQLSAMKSVSQSSVLVLMDQIYLVAYASIVFTLGRVIWDNHKVKNEEDDQHIAEVAQKDRVTLILQAAITTAILIVLVLPKLF